MSDFEDFDFKKPKVEEEEKQEAVETDNAPKAEKPKYSQDELFQIFDEMIFSGTYTETVSIRGGKLKVGFRARSAEEIANITMKLDTSSANLVSTINEKRSLLNLHYALVSYQGKDFSTTKVEDKAAFINKLPGAVVGALMHSLAKFDDKVYAACRESEENF